MRFPLLIICALTLTGCDILGGAQGIIDPTACPPVHTWTADQQKEAANELRVLGPNAILNDFMRDYKRMRNESDAATPPTLFKSLSVKAELENH